ncbi:MAG TPA: LysM domain-containing protein [Solirubrobacteraceae bacterium]|jgi:LysM repeat protein|nr:LysM domain-containing protein [Solirubrobacteraceae bacterium]
MVAKTARFLAPIALAAVGVGVYLIVHSTVGQDTSSVASSTSGLGTGRQHATHKRRRSPKYYVVKSGDTLSRISSHVHVPVAELTTLNPSLSSDPNSLQTGQRLRLRR